MFFHCSWSPKKWCDCKIPKFQPQVKLKLEDAGSISPVDTVRQFETIELKRTCRGFLKWWYPTTMGFPTKNDHFRVFWGYHHLRKHPYQQTSLFSSAFYQGMDAEALCKVFRSELSWDKLEATDVSDWVEKYWADSDSVFDCSII